MALYDTTFMLQRLSPLYVGNSSFSNDALKVRAKQLRDVLAGDVVRGVEIGGSGESVIERFGALESVTWRLLTDEELWTTPEDETQYDATLSSETARGMLVTVTFEARPYKAIILRNTQGLSEESTIGVSLDAAGFRSFPLLLTKMPGGVRDTFINFLSTTFDAKVSTLHLSSKCITSTLEQYMAYVCVGDDGSLLEDAGDRSRTLRSILGAVTVSVGFNIPQGSNSLKTIEIQIAREELPRILSANELGNGNEPFLNAMTAYVKTHMAMDLKHPMVRIIGVVSEAFTLIGDGRAILRAANTDVQRRATKRLLDGLITLSTSEGKSVNMERVSLASI